MMLWTCTKGCGAGSIPGGDVTNKSNCAWITVKYFITDGFSKLLLKDLP